MARGPKKHLKRLHAPKHWMLGKMDGIWAPRPSPGPHKLRESLPLVLILRNRLKYALTMQEVKMITMQKLVTVDGKIRTDPTFPAGFMDVVEIPKSGDQFRLMYDTKGRYVLHRINDEEKSYKLARVTRVELTKKKIPYLATHDGRTIRYPDPAVAVKDTVKIDLATGKIAEVFKYELGATAMITKGRNTGRVGVITGVEKHPGSFDIVTVRDETGAVFATRSGNVFVVGRGGDAAVSLPKGKGIKRTIIEERDALAAKRA